MNNRSYRFFSPSIPLEDEVPLSLEQQQQDPPSYPPLRQRPNRGRGLFGIKPPPSSIPNLADDWGQSLKSLLHGLNPINSAQAEEMPPWQGGLESKKRLTHFAIKGNEGGGYRIAHAGTDKSGYSFGLYQGDISGNDDAMLAFDKLIESGLDKELLTKVDRDFLAKNPLKKGKPKDMELLKMKMLMEPVMELPEGRKIVDEMDEALGKGSHGYVESANTKSVAGRRRALNPIEQATLAIWRNRAGGLEETGNAFFDQLKGADTKSVLNWVLGQRNFTPKKGDSPDLIRNKLRQKIHHMEATADSIQKALEEGVIKTTDISDEAQIALNEVLKEVRSKKRYYFKRLDRFKDEI